MVTEWSRPIKPELANFWGFTVNVIRSVHESEAWHSSAFPDKLEYLSKWSKQTDLFLYLPAEIWKDIWQLTNIERRVEFNEVFKRFSHVTWRESR